MSTTDRHHSYQHAQENEHAQDAARAAQIKRTEEIQREERVAAVPRTIGFAAFAIISFAAFLWFGLRAEVMPTDSAGAEVTALHSYSAAAALTFSLAILAWAATLVSAWYANEPFRQRALAIFGVFMPVAFSVAYFGSAR